jgi:ABC-type lipoprotein release transport system permease subunit
VPTRPALLAGAAGVLGVVAALTLLAGLDDAVGHPERFGSTWDVEMAAPIDSLDQLAGIRQEVAGVDGVAGAIGVVRANLPLAGAGTPVYVLEPDPDHADLTFVTVSGRPPVRPGEIALGPATARALGVEVGSTVDLGERPVEVVGLAFLPITPHSSYDQGVWATFDDADAAGLADAPDAEPALMVRAAPGVDAAALAGRLADRFLRGDQMAMPTQVPVELANLRNVRPLPRLFAAFTVLLAIGALAHLTTSVVRRRRGDLAVLRAIGMTAGQTRTALLVQASTLALLGAVVGIPLGLVAGRSTWRWIAEVTPLVYVAPLALLAVLLTVPVAVVVANLLAALPARRAARLRPATVLRAE